MWQTVSIFLRITVGFIVPLGQIAHSIALDTTGDGTVDKVVPIEDKDKYIVGEDA